MQTLKFLASVLLFVGVATFSIVLNSSVGCGPSKRLKALITLSKLKASIHEFRIDTGGYPGSLNELISNNQGQRWMGPYIKPNELTDPWGGAYQYELNSDQQSYFLLSQGSDHQFSGNKEATDMIVLTRTLVRND